MISFKHLIDSMIVQHSNNDGSNNANNPTSQPDEVMLLTTMMTTTMAVPHNKPLTLQEYLNTLITPACFIPQHNLHHIGRHCPTNACMCSQQYAWMMTIKPKCHDEHNDTGKCISPSKQFILPKPLE